MTLKIVDYTGVNKIQYWIITIRTKPGNVLFEFTVRYNNKDFIIIGSLNRLNLYENQNSCISDFP